VNVSGTVVSGRPHPRTCDLMAMLSKEIEEEPIVSLQGCQSLENLSLGGVAAIAPQKTSRPKYRHPKEGELSTYQGAGVIPLTRMPDGEVRILLWQPQKGKKTGVRWYDFGGQKKDKDEFASNCACRKLAKETYGLFGCSIAFDGVPVERIPEFLGELYQGLYNLPLMQDRSQAWAQIQLLENGPKVFYNDVREYHTYLLAVPFVSDEILNMVSQIVDGGKRIFRWLSQDDLREEVLAPRLHMHSLAQQLEDLPDDPWIYAQKVFQDRLPETATSSFSVTVRYPPGQGSR